MISFVTILWAFALAANAHPFHVERATTSPITQCNHGFSMTFDDGPYIHTTNVSNNLIKAGGKGTFYMNGRNWGCIYDDEMVAHVKNVYNAGHQIASHTWSHPDITTLNNDQLDIEIMRLDQAFIKILGIKPNIFRPPYGAITSAQVDYITTKHKKTVVTWDKDTADTAGANTNALVLKFYQNLADKAVASGKMPRDPQFTLSHDVQEQTGTSSLEAANILVKASYSLVTTAQCLDIAEPYTVVGSPQARDSTWTCNGDWSVSDYSEKPSTRTTTSTSAPTSSSCSKTYTVQPGDYCWLIANNNGLSVEQLQSYNPSLNCDNLQIGTVLKLCASSSSPASSTSASTTTPTGGCSKKYTVQPGDYCWLIANNNGLTVEQLTAYNPGLNCDNLQPGMVVNLCASGSSASTSTRSATTSTRSSTSSVRTSSLGTSTRTTSTTSTRATTKTTSAGSTSSTACPKAYTVKSGDYCWLIANNNGITVAQLQAANPTLKCNNLQPKTKLKIPCP